MTIIQHIHYRLGRIFGVKYRKWYYRHTGGRETLEGEWRDGRYLWGLYTFINDSFTSTCPGNSVSVSEFDKFLSDVFSAKGK